MPDRIVDSTWFTQMGGGVIGVVMVDTEYDGLCFYIGNGVGYNQETDEQHIAARGARFPYTAGLALFGIREEREA